MDIDALRSFLAFVETGSFTRAAKQISRTQSAFSAQMRKLEDETGSSLFEKEGRNLVLSEAGLRLSNHAQDLVLLHDDALAKMKRHQDKRALKLGCPEDYNETILPTLIAALKASEPACSIQIFSEPSCSLRHKLDVGELDAAILTRSPDSEEGYWLVADQGVWISEPDFRYDEQQPLPLVLFQADCKYHAAAIDGLNKRATPYQLLACCNTASAQRSLVRKRLGVGAMGRLSVSADLAIIEDMPALPAVDIVLAVSSKGHPLLSQPFLMQLESMFQ